MYTCSVQHSLYLGGEHTLAFNGAVVMYVCMYLMIGKGQIAQKRPYWGENRLKSTIKRKYKYLVVF